MRHKKMMIYFLLCSLSIFFTSCEGQSQNENASPKKEQRKMSPTGRPVTQKSTGKGSLSFKMDGKLYQTHPGHSKCWTVSSVPLAMLMAKGEGLSISWQMGYKEGEDLYKLDGDRKGTVNFTIDGKTYWTRSVTGDNYLDIKITHVKDKYTLKMLSGTFEGVLEDKEGKKVTISEGRFTTENIGS